MSKFVISVFGIALTCNLFTCFVCAEEYHVAKSGNDGSPGTESAPFLTIQKAANVAVAGDVVIVYEGRYDETLRPANSGTAGNPIVYRAKDGDKVIITAMQPLGGWTLDQGSIYKTTVDWDLGQNNFVMNGPVACDLARWPNNTDGDPFTLNSLRNTGGSDEHVKDNAYLDYDAGIPPYDWSQGGYVFFYCDKSGWTSWRSWITSNTATRVHCVLPSSWVGGSHPPAGLGDFYLGGIKETLDYANEWYFDVANNTLYFQTPDGTTPADDVVMMKRREVAIDLEDRHYIEIRNLAVLGGSIEITGSASNNLLYGVSSIYGNHTSGVVDSFVTGTQSIAVHGSNNVIEKCEIAFGTGSGIRVEGTNNIVKNSSIHDFDYIGDYDAPIMLRRGTKTTITGNVIYRGGRDCIQLFNTNSVVSYNNVYSSNLIADDCGLIYTVGGPYHCEIHHNWFHDIFSRGKLYKAAGIYLDNDAAGFKVHHNVVWNTEWTSVQINLNGRDLDIFNNTLWSSSEAMGAWHRKGTAFSNVRVWNNLADNDNWEQQADKQNNLTMTSDPFVNSVEGDFSVKAGTQPIDYGKQIAGVTDGFVGAAPDAGAYEYGAMTWTAGIDWDENTGPTGYGCYGLIKK